MQNSADYQAPPVEGIAGGGTGYGWNEASVKSTNSIGRVVDVTKQPTSDLLHVWCMPSTATISHQEPPRSLEQLHLLAARNERESAQLALRPKISWSGGGSAGHVKLQFTNLKSSSGAELEVGKSVTARHVIPILGVPDALVPLKMPIANISLLPGETCGIWLSVDVPSSQPPGLYEGEICISAVKGNAEDDIRSPTEADRREVRKDIQALISNTSTTNENLTQELADGLRSIHCGLEKLLRHPSLSMSHEENGKMDIDGDSDTELAIRVKINVTVWDFVLPLTPSLPSVFGISETVIEDRFGVEHGSSAWYSALDMHYKWLLQYRISPYFCRWGDSMRVLTYTCPWPADHPKAEEYYSDTRLAAYAVPYAPVLTSTSTGEDVARKELEILKTKSHWKKAYFYLWDEPLSLEQYETIRTMSEKIRSVAPDARVLTTYYCGPSNASVPPGSFEAFVKVPTFLRPHTQIYCTSEWVLGGHEELIKDILSELQPENNEEWWTYVCMGPSDPHPNWHLGMRGTQHRAVMWRVWKEGGTGFLYWGANCYEKALAPAAEIRFRRGLPPGDGVLFYPGEVFDPEATEPVASARLERILSGLQDYEYLNLYASRYGRGAALGLLEKCGLYFGPENYAHDHVPIDAFRSEVYHSCRIT